MIDQKKRRGRPNIPLAQRRRHNQTFRCNDELLSDLRTAAAANQRSVSEEAEARIAETFERALMRTMLREEIAAAFESERKLTPPRTTALDEAAAGDSFRITFHPQWRDYLPS